MIKGNVVKFKNIILGIFFVFMSFTSAYAESAKVNFEIMLPEYLRIQTITSAVLVANITDDTGNLYYPLSSKFRVISNSPVKKTLYLKSESMTENGSESSMFDMGGKVYIAFTNIKKQPSSDALTNCKIGTHPKFSPGVVAYPITSIVGTKSRYLRGQGKYEVYINNGVTDISVNIGSYVLRNSFDKNDPKGFYQATLLLTESEV